ncbi:MAG: septum formation initiator family protein [Blautia sp.]|nr:septum formation initiator family protein [Blautia sp.]
MNRVYMEGNAVRRLQELPDYDSEEFPGKKRRSARPVQRNAANANSSREPSEAARRNREKALSMGKGFVLFLSVISVAILFACVYYLQLKSEITSSMKQIAQLESELTSIREDNDAYESQVTSNVDISRIRKIAIGRLGMKFPDEGQTVDYQTVVGSYVRQYQDVPDAK